MHEVKQDPISLSGELPAKAAAGLFLPDDVAVIFRANRGLGHELTWDTGGHTRQGWKAAG